jgi:APA family basic amino acid/polyamine antiporter
VTELRRSIGGGQLLLYGLGSMLGTGIYGLIGKAAGTMGSAVWIAFLVAMVAALLTGISYASIASRYPKAGGAAYATQRAYGAPWLSYLVGLTVLSSGLASIATQAKVVAENVNLLVGVDFGFSVLSSPAEILLIGVVFLLLLSGIVFRGITTSVWVNTAFTVVAALGLLLVIAVGVRFWGQADLFEVPKTPGNPYGDLTLGLLLQGSILTFFSFLGFEDMLNVAEEVERPERNMPIGIIGAMLAASVIYMAVAITAVSVVPWAELASDPGPLKLVVERAAPWFPAVGFTVITIAAVSNTALVNYVMGSRLLYGMAQQGLIPAILGTVHSRRRTPHIAIGALLVVVVAMQFVGDIAQLASATVLLLLIVFALVNAALIVLKLREGDIPGCFNAPIVVPVLGVLICLAMIAARIVQADWYGPALTLALLVAIMFLYFVTAKAKTLSAATT